MPRFLTLDPEASRDPMLLWDDEAGRLHVVQRFARPDDDAIPDNLEIWTFDVSTTARVGQSPNKGQLPVLDQAGAPLWAGARIAFRLPAHFVNTYSGEGAFCEADLYGGFRFEADQAFPNWDRQGAYSTVGRQRYSSCGRVERTGLLEGHRVLASELGDSHEHGTTRTFVRMIDDPRRVCHLTYEPGRSFGRSA